MHEIEAGIPGHLFSPIDISIKLAITIGIGMLVGLEREWSQKDLGTRTFTITAMLGTLGVLAAPEIAYIAFAGVLLIVLLAGARHVREGKPVETTTSAAVILTFILGVLVGLGHHYTPVAAAILMTLLLALKPALTHFTGGLQVAEVRSAVLLGLLGFVIFPVLPDRAVDPWQIVNPRQAWLTVIVIAALGFVNYVLLKIYGSRGLYYTAVLGGMVNSTATILELAGYFRANISLAAIINLLTILAMFVRNLLILAIFARAAVPGAAAPLGAMTLAALVFLWRHKGSRQDPIGELKLSSPVALGKVFKFGLLFLVIEIAGSLAERYLGHFGFLLVSVVGGFVSSASTVGAAAALAMHDKITPQTAGLATVLASMASALSNLPVIYQQGRDWGVTRYLVLVSVVIVGMGIAAMFFLRN